MFTRSEIRNPKRHGTQSVGRSGWYPYYAGFSLAFANDLLASTSLPKKAKVLDPWNGSGTITEAAARIQRPVVGIDLNPAMVVVARGRALCQRELSSLCPLAHEIAEQARTRDFNVNTESEPLSVWLTPAGARAARSIERAIYRLLVDENAIHQFPSEHRGLDRFSDIACFFYVALFRAMRGLLGQFFSSNPTWVKRPKNKSDRLRLRSHTVFEKFESEVAAMVEVGNLEPFESDSPTEIRVDSSTKLPFADDEFDLVVSSPPYCTRIDYAVATLIELAVLGFHPSSGIRPLRQSLLGTSTIDRFAQETELRFGKECDRFLSRLSSHPSKASTSYYLPNHQQYFVGIRNSVAEISRVLKPGGGCVLVVQDSYLSLIHI